MINPKQLCYESIILRILIIGLLLGCSRASFSQDSELSSHFRLLVSQMNLKYIASPDLVETKIPYTPFAPHSNSGYLDGPFYALKDKAGDLLITFGLLNAKPLLSNPAKYNYRDNDHIIKMNYLIDTRPLFIEKNGLVERIKRDSTFQKSKGVKLYKGKILKSYGADDAGIIDVPIDELYLNKYDKLKIFFMYKSGIGEVYIQYFYKQGAKINKYIKLTEHMLTFQ